MLFFCFTWRRPTRPPLGDSSMEIKRYPLPIFVGTVLVVLLVVEAKSIKSTHIMKNPSKHLREEDNNGVKGKQNNMIYDCWGEWICHLCRDCKGIYWQRMAQRHRIHVIRMRLAWFGDLFAFTCDYDICWDPNLSEAFSGIFGPSSMILTIIHWSKLFLRIFIKKLFLRMA